MAKAKVNPYISVDLDWAESQLATWRQYVDEHPIHLLEDRWGKKEMPKGGYAWVVTATIEAQGKFIEDTFAKYLQLLEVVANMRKEKEQEEMKLRGDGEVNSMMKRAMEKTS